MKILVSYRGIPQSPGWATGDMVVKAFRALGHEVYPYAKYYQENRWVEGRPMLDDHDWDLVLFMECNDEDPQYPELDLMRARKTACWLFDTSYHQDRYRRLVDYFKFDHIFLANPLTIREYIVWGYQNVHYLPYACDRELHSRSLEYPKTRDVVLVGSIRDDRRTLIAQLCERGLNAELIGGVFREEYIDALASSRVVVNQNPEIGRGLLNMRHFEAQAAGCFLIEQWKDLHDNMHAGLSVWPTCFNYETINDIVDVCRDFLGDHDTLAELIAAPRESFFAEHTYQKRCERILETVFPNG